MYYEHILEFFKSQYFNIFVNIFISSIVKYTHFLNKLIIFLIEILNEEFEWIKGLIQHIKIQFIFYNETSIIAMELDTRVIKQ